MFRISDIGCLLDLSWVVEVVDRVADLLQIQPCDPNLGIIGALPFRQTRIPVVDPTRHLRLNSGNSIEDKVALVLKSSEGNWALLVDRVEDICPEEQLQHCDVPPLLKAGPSGYFPDILLRRNEPLMVIEPERLYGSLVTA